MNLCDAYPEEGCTRHPLQPRSLVPAQLALLAAAPRRGGIGGPCHTTRRHRRPCRTRPETLRVQTRCRSLLAGWQRLLARRLDEHGEGVGDLGAAQRRLSEFLLGGLVLSRRTYRATKALERLADGGAEHAQLGQHLLEVLVDDQAARLLELLVKG